jgi:hypothetical protein
VVRTQSGLFWFPNPARATRTQGGRDCATARRRRVPGAGCPHRPLVAASERGGRPGPARCLRGPFTRRRDEEDKLDEYESVPSILLYVIVESETRSFRAFWRHPGDRAWSRRAADAAGPIRIPEFGIELTLDEIYARAKFDRPPSAASGRTVCSSPRAAAARA